MIGSLLVAATLCSALGSTSARSMRERTSHNRNDPSPNGAPAEEDAKYWQRELSNSAVDTAIDAPEPTSSLSGLWEGVAPFGVLPDGRTWGSTSAVYPAPDGEHIWIADRCGDGGNSCEGKGGVDPIFLFDLKGNLVRSFGNGTLLWPHGMHVDPEGNVWVTDAVGYGEQPTGWGHVILKFSPEGELLMTLGETGVPGEDSSHFRKPSDVLISPGGDIFVADGHDSGPNTTVNNRIVKFSRDGVYIKEWGGMGSEAGQFRDPHALAMDSKGRLFVGDRANSRIQIFDQDGNHLATWTQFGRPSGLFIDRNDILYSADSESNYPRNAGFRRGIYIGSVNDGWVTDFILDPTNPPDPDTSPTSGAEGVAVDSEGNIYGAEVNSHTVRKYMQRND